MTGLLRHMSGAKDMAKEKRNERDPLKTVGKQSNSVGICGLELDAEGYRPYVLAEVWAFPPHVIGDSENTSLHFVGYSR